MQYPIRTKKKNEGLSGKILIEYQTFAYALVRNTKPYSSCKLSDKKESNRKFPYNVILSHEHIKQDHSQDLVNLII